MALLPEPFDPRVYDLMRRLKSDPDAGAKLLGIAAEYLLEQKRMPPELAKYLAKAFTLTAKNKYPDHRAHMLTHQLNIKAGHRLKAQADWMDAYDVIKRTPDAGETAWKKLLMQETDIGRTKAKELFDEAMKYIRDVEPFL